MKLTRRLVVHGRVQGVNFREAMRDEAQRLGVTGWVRNRGDGTVEATVHGAADAVERIVDWARHGPPAARVTRVEIAEAEGAFESFERLPSLY
jgi:acylphosphatase